jgi:hypothetical protein
LRVNLDSLYSGAMATRRPPRVRCSIVVNVPFASLLAIAGVIVGCEGRDNVAGGRLDAGGGSSGGGSGAGGSGNGSISCNPTGAGCLCIVDDPQPGQLTACSPTSVAQNEMERGICCLTLSLCTCIRYTCRSAPASSFCQCGTVTDLAAVTLGDPVAECPMPVAGQKCCFSGDNATCSCALRDCDAAESEVPNCSAVNAGACNGGEGIPTCR